MTVRYTPEAIHDLQSLRENRGRSPAGYAGADPGGTGAGDPLLRPQDPVYLPHLPGAGKRQHYGGEAS